MNFNPRSREVSDTAGRWYHFTVGNFNPRSREVSDALSDHMALALLNFNPRSREVSDFWATSGQGRPTSFQSTLPRGERLHLLTFFRLQYGYILFHLTNKYSFCF